MVDSTLRYGSDLPERDMSRRNALSLQQNKGM